MNGSEEEEEEEEAWKEECIILESIKENEKKVCGKPRNCVMLFLSYSLNPFLMNEE